MARRQNFRTLVGRRIDFSHGGGDRSSFPAVRGLVSGTGTIDDATSAAGPMLLWSELLDRPRIECTAVVETGTVGTLALAHAVSLGAVADTDSQGTVTLAHTLTATGAVNDSEALGTADVHPAGLTLVAVADADTIGQAALAHVVQLVALDETEAPGTPVLAHLVSLAAIGDLDTLGSPALQHVLAQGAVQDSEAAGTLLFQHLLHPTVSDGEAAGTLALAHLVSLAGIGEDEDQGQPTLAEGLHAIQALGVDELESWGAGLIFAPFAHTAGKVWLVQRPLSGFQVPLPMVDWAPDSSTPRFKVPSA